MRISELADVTGTTVTTLKFYLRRGLLHPGRSVTRTQADYDAGHVERVRLVVALSEVGGLDLAAVGRVLEAIETPDVGRLDVMATAQHALSGERAHEPAAGEEDTPRGDERTRAWIAAREWQVDLGDVIVDRLAQAWRACDDAGIGLDEGRLDAYADAAERIARIDVASVPSEPAAAVRQVVLGTVLVEPVLTALRLLAQQHVALTGRADPDK
ncbi:MULTISPECIES: MerR family transcriptional regulator [unclassified Dietzia]|uniref:MerR family transcriptional regulator n=1 Tax=unclassified Dietzia TaxID=2617939 RepID=UPI000D223B12|nr:MULTISPECIES: MerR family transcriptional regulator [unclassified Dietzia]AVZ40921.1 transcriptional regulator [Dietzia sp. JS16-p6b]MBB1024061.1 MerR family transcriptional regulator [Dietzia sp. DQ12-76]MBB1028419.1 MerR family transcriptional regulator [Dietzia sp. DQ11-38-2]QGW26562.1 putative MerR family transcriptional regulator [Dietzia sp. DQ12-45-1b]